MGKKKNISIRGMSSRELYQILAEDGWYEVSVEGSHHQFKHKDKKGRVTLKHPVKDLPVKTVKSILMQAGLV